MTMMITGCVRLPFDWIAWRLHWRARTALLERAFAFGLTPQPPRPRFRGERADELEGRIDAEYGAVMDRLSGRRVPIWAQIADSDSPELKRC